MARSALTAPAHVVLQRSPGQFTGAGSTVSPDACTSHEYGGGGLLDHRMPFNKFNALGNGAAAACVGWNGGVETLVMDATPASTSLVNIAAAQNATSGVPLTLVSASTLGVSVLATPVTTMPFGTVIPANAVCMGSATGVQSNTQAGAPGYMFLGIRDVTAFYDPTTALSYVIQITGQTGATGGNMIVRGFDFYGQAMSETIAAPAAGTTTPGLKAWKAITSITPQFTDAHNYTVGTTLTIGLHLAVDFAGYFFPYTTAAGWVTTPATGFTASLGSTTINTAATATNADVRGTWVASNTRTLLYVTLSSRRANNLSSLGGMTTGLFGVTQFTQ